MIVKPFQQQSRYTTMDNFIIDHVMPKISGSAWKVLTVIIRKTIGWHKECDELSFNQIKTLTGIKTNTTVSEALKDLEEMNVIKVDRPDLSGDNPARFWKSNIYSLNLDFEVEVGTGESSPVIEPPPSLKNRLPPSPVIEPPLVQKIDTQKKKNPNKDSEIHCISPISEKLLTPHQQMFETLADICRSNVKLMAGRIGKTVKELREAGATPESLKAFKEWWYSQNYLGKQDKPPTLAQVKETLGEFEAFQKKHSARSASFTPSPDSPEPERIELSPEERILATFKERAAERIPAPQWREHIAPMQVVGCQGGRIQVEVNQFTKEIIEGRFSRVLDPIAQQLIDGGFEYVVI